MAEPEQSLREDVPAVVARLAFAKSRELLFECGGDGVVRWADVRARELLGAVPGVSLEALCTSGARAGARELIAAAGQRDVDAFELEMLVHGVPLAVSISTTRSPDGGFGALGALASDRMVQMLVDARASTSTIAALRGEIADHKIAFARSQQELQDSNKGVLTLHAELAAGAHSYHQSTEVRDRVVSNVSHELRTPLHSILGLTQLLIDRSDGALNGEQEKQVNFIRSSAEELLQLVDDVLDLSKAEAGRMTLRAETFDASDFVASARGMLKPLVLDQPVELVIEDAPAACELETDRTKLSQIVRNLVSNAVKFTEQGEVRVTVACDDENVSFSVRDTGIGIAPDDLDIIFEEFAQLRNALPDKKMKGTGLGLSLSKKLADLLGGEIVVESALGKGSTFTLTIPRVHPEVRELHAIEDRSRSIPVGPSSILVVEDDRKSIFVYEKYLSMAGFHVIPARTIEEARSVIARARPAAIVLDIMLEGESSWSFLEDMKRNPETSEIPVLVVTVTNREQKARALGADEFWLKPVDQDRLLKRLRALARTTPAARVLVIDDDERARYLVKKHLEGTLHVLIEAGSGAEGIELATKHAPHVILLDFLLEEGTAFDVLDELKADPRTRGIPVIIITSQVLDANDRARLLVEADSVISKQHLSRELAINRIRDALRKAGIAATL